MPRPYSIEVINGKVRMIPNGAAPIHNLINHRAWVCEGGIMVYGSMGQGVRRYSPCLDLSFAAGVRYEHEIFGLKATAPTT